ncbi:HAD-IA family hydrolase [Sinorhizobium medicae]|uniref:HAD-IA family hydrolase n=1 Tax=Sinorhizobium medicae TaxID=110321 RepID=UPI0018657111|nr:HAD-IA family hydrolase [Sinorhizobium medicae]
MLFVFDVGGVLVDLNPVARDSALHVETCIAGAGIPHIKSYANASAVLLRDFRLGKIAEQTYVDRLAEELETSASQIYLAEHSFISKQNDHLIQIIHQLRQTHRVVCLSNTQSIHWQHLTHYRLGNNLFDHTYLSHELGLEKPDPEIFKVVTIREKYPVESIVLIDDTIENVDAAKRFGWVESILHEDTDITSRQIALLATA